MTEISDFTSKDATNGAVLSGSNTTSTDDAGETAAALVIGSLMAWYGAWSCTSWLGKLPLRGTARMQQLTFYSRVFLHFFEGW